MSSVVGRDAYTVLGVGVDADDEAIAAAYRGLARQFHPDIAGELATRRMVEINTAFEAIRTADRRAEYAAEMHAAGSPVGHPRPAPRHDPDTGRMTWRPERDGTGAAGPPPGRPSGSVLRFGRHIGWSLGEIASVDPGYLVWLAERREGRPYRAEIEAIMQRIRTRSLRKETVAEPRRGRFGIG